MPIIDIEIEIEIKGIIKTTVIIGTGAELIIRMIDRKTGKIIDRKQLCNTTEPRLEFA